VATDSGMGGLRIVASPICVVPALAGAPEAVAKTVTTKPFIRDGRPGGLMCGGSIQPRRTLQVRRSLDHSANTHLFHARSRTRRHK
jgi:hypothetical protein